MIELVDEYGPEEIMRYVEAILDYADRNRTADEIRSMPDGKYYAEGYVDTDGAGNTDLKVAVTLNIDDDKIHADFTGGSSGSGGTNLPRVLWKRLREFQSFAQSMRKYHIMMVVCGTLPVTLQRGPL